MRLKILIRLRKIASIQSVLNENCNKYGVGIKNKKRLKVKIARLYKNIQGYVNEIHKKLLIIYVKIMRTYYYQHLKLNR